MGGDAKQGSADRTPFRAGIFGDTKAQKDAKAAAFSLPTNQAPLGAFGGRVAPDNPRAVKQAEKAPRGNVATTVKTTLNRSISTHPNNRDTLGHFKRDAGHQTDHYVRTVDEKIKHAAKNGQVLTENKVQ